MTTKAQKTPRDVRLKLAIVATGRKQRAIARSARIHEVRLSKLVTGSHEATPEEQRRIAKAVGRTVDELFGAHDAVSA